MTFPRLFVALALHGNLQSGFERQPQGLRATFPGEALTWAEGPAVPTAGCYGRGLNVSIAGNAVAIWPDQPRAKGLAERRGGRMLLVPGTRRSPSAIYHAAARLAHLAG